MSYTGAATHFKENAIQWRFAEYLEGHPGDWSAPITCKELKMDAFLRANESQLLGYSMICSASNQPIALDAPYPPSVLSKDELEVLKERLSRCMPVDGMIAELRDWDVHLDDELSDDWYFSTVFGDVSGIDSCTEQLVEFFMEQCARLELDYGQSPNDEEFDAHVLDNARNFVLAWRRNVISRYGSGVK